MTSRITVYADGREHVFKTDMTQNEFGRAMDNFNNGNESIIRFVQHDVSEVVYVNPANVSIIKFH